MKNTETETPIRTVDPLRPFVRSSPILVIGSHCDGAWIEERLETELILSSDPAHIADRAAEFNALQIQRAKTIADIIHERSADNLRDNPASVSHGSVHYGDRVLYRCC